MLDPRTPAQRRSEADKEWARLQALTRPAIKISNGAIVVTKDNSDGRITMKAGKNRIWLDRNESAELVAAIQELTA